MTNRIILFAFIMLSITTFIGWIFWKQELQYALPTPIPANFVDVKVGAKVILNDRLKIKEGNFALLHFFNFNCPCSRFNMKEFESLAFQYKDKVNFIVVIQSEDENAIAKFQDKYDLNIPVVLDRDGAISDRCGIYATPQAVLFDSTSTIYFKGNYNKTRFCTRKETKFVELALNYLIKNEPLPLFMQYALTEPYGCSLPTNEVKGKTASLINLF